MYQNKALIIMDMQNDFSIYGPIPHEKSLDIIPIINQLRGEFKIVFLIIEEHQENHSSFKKYPPHCIADQKGSEFIPHLDILDTDIIIKRGTLQKYSSTSAFYDAEDIQKETNFRNILQMNNITDLYFCGISMDKSIFSTVLDAINFKYNCYLYKNAIAYSNINLYNKNIAFLEKLEVTII